jgi:hypothetical protein
LGKIDSTGLFVCGVGYIIAGSFHGDWIAMVNGGDRHFQSSALTDRRVHKPNATPLNRSNLNLATTALQFRKTNVRTELFGAFSIS